MIKGRPVHPDRRGGRTCIGGVHARVVVGRSTGGSRVQCGRPLVDAVALTPQIHPNLDGYMTVPERHSNTIIVPLRRVSLTSPTSARCGRFGRLSVAAPVSIEIGKCPPMLAKLGPNLTEFWSIPGRDDIGFFETTCCSTSILQRRLYHRAKPGGNRNRPRLAESGSNLADMGRNTVELRRVRAKCAKFVWPFRPTTELGSGSTKFEPNSDDSRPKLTTLDQNWSGIDKSLPEFDHFRQS